MTAPFACIPGESFNGVVARWADQIGGVERMIDLTRFAGVRYGHLQRAASADEADIRALAEEMDIDPGELLARATPNSPGEWTNSRFPMMVAGVAVPSLMIEKRVRRYSPTALAQSPHHRALWDVRLLPACTETGEILRARCGRPECGPLGWTATLGIDSCEHCMADLSAKTADRISEEDRVTLGEIGGLFGGDHARAATLALLPSDVAALGASDVIDLLTRIAPVVDRSLPTDLAGLLNAEPRALCAAVASSWRVLVGWPAAVAELAARHVAARTGRHNDGNGGRTMRLLSRKRHLGASEAVLDLLAAFKRSISVDADEGRDLLARTISGTTVARITGLDTDHVTEYRRAGKFRVHFSLDLGRPEARYDAVEIEGIRIALTDRASVAAARGALGISCHGVEQLVAMRLLDAIDHPFLDAHYGARQVSRSSLETLKAAIADSSSGPINGNAVTLRSAAKGIGGHVKPWGAIFAMLVSGELPFSLSAEGGAVTDAILVDETAVALLADLRLSVRVRARLSPVMSKVDAAEMLNLNAAKITALLANVVTGTGSHLKAVPLELVERLARRHISVAEIATRRRVSHLRAHRDALGEGIPHLGAGGFCRRQTERIFFR